MSTLRESIHALRQSRASSPVALIVFFLATLFCWRSFDDSGFALPRQFLAVEELCFPFEHPGYLDWDRDLSPLHAGVVSVQLDNVSRARWLSLTDACPQTPGQDWLTLLNRAVVPAQLRDALSPEELEYWQSEQSSALKRTAWLRRKTILIIGDSVDRNGLEHLAWMLGKPFRFADYLNASIVDTPIAGWDSRNLPHFVDLPELDLRISNVFHYGSQADEFALATDYHAPGRYEGRLAELFVPHTQQLAHPPSFVVFHSGLWDLCASPYTSADRMTTSAQSSIRSTDCPSSMLNATQTAYPDATVLFRGLHRPGPRGAEASAHFALGQAFHEDDTHFFSDLRVHQLRQAQAIVCKELKVPFIDFGAVFEGWQTRQNAIHPEGLPGVFAYWWPVLKAIELEEQRRRSRWSR